MKALATLSTAAWLLAGCSSSHDAGGASAAAPAVNGNGGATSAGGTANTSSAGAGGTLQGAGGASGSGGDSSSASGAGAGGVAAGGSAGSAGSPAAGAGGSGGEANLDDCTPMDGSVMPDVVSVVVTNPAGEAPSKGDALRFDITIENAGMGVGMATITPLIGSQRFSDYAAVPLASVEVALCRGSNVVSVEGGPFLAKPAENKHYALGAGDYSVSAVSVALAGAEPLSDDDLQGASFSIASSNALLVPVVYDAAYLPAVTGHDAATVEEFLSDSFTRPNQIFTPSGPDPDGDGAYQSFAGGFDEMMGVRHHFRAFDGFPGETTTEQGWCEDATAYGQTALGMSSPWTGSGTLTERHGFDYLIALTPYMGGGVACGWLDVQVSGLINNDHDRQQVIAVHESGHLFGAPHCDDVGDGSGGSLQGYVMCSGEKHPQYPANFVWHSTSIATMSSHWD